VRGNGARTDVRPTISALSAPSPLRQALANREIRLAELAWMLGIGSETAFLVALLVNAYEVGGTFEVGLVGVFWTLPAGVLAPIIAGLTEQVPRHRLLALVHLGRAAAIAALALTAATRGTPALMLVLASAEGLIATLHRPSHMSLLPELASAPEELVAGNVVSGAAENLGSLVGPLVGAATIALGGPVLTFVVAAGGLTLAAATISLTHPASQPPRIAERGLRRALDGAAALREHPTAALLVGMGLTQTFVRGLLTVLLVAASAELLSLGDRGYGFLQSAIGFGGIVGAIVMAGGSGRARLSTLALVGLALWGLPIIAIGLVPNNLFAVAVLVVLGIGNATFDVGLFSIIQRNVPNRSRPAVLGLFEGLIMLTVGMGALVAPVLVLALGLRGALIVAGLVLPVLVAVAARATRAADRATVVPERQMQLLRGIDMFRPLPLTVVEHLAGSLVPGTYAAGEPIVLEGESGDRFFIIDEGTAEVESHGHGVRALGPGDGFGEIALLRSVPRTATVRAVTDMKTFALLREDFTSTVSGNRVALGVADALVGNRLGEDVVRG
jgi:MFS family permease